MNILVVSDSHGRQGDLQDVIYDVGKIDLLIHCGDTEGMEREIIRMAGCPCRIVSGNNDFFTGLPREDEFTLGDYSVWLCHGHNYGVSMGYEMLLDEAVSRQVDIVFFGHTHRPCVMKKRGVWLVNPGSISYPRQEGRKKSYILMEIDREGEAHFSINYLEQQTI